MKGDIKRTIEILEKFNKLILEKRTHPLLPSPTLSPCIINGGTKNNTIPDYCEVHIDRRLIPGEVKENFKFFDKLEKVYAKTLNKSLEFKPFNGACEQTLFINKGIDTIILGPGRLEEAHIANEYIEIEQLEEAFDLYFNLIKEIL